jgi:hypothetical protein
MQITLVGIIFQGQAIFLSVLHCFFSEASLSLIWIFLFTAVLRIRIRIRRISKFLRILGPDPDSLVRGMGPDPDPSIIKQK